MCAAEKDHTILMCAAEKAQDLGLKLFLLGQPSMSGRHYSLKHCSHLISISSSCMNCEVILGLYPHILSTYLTN